MARNTCSKFLALGHSNACHLFWIKGAAEMDAPAQTEAHQFRDWHGIVRI